MPPRSPLVADLHTHSVLSDGELTPEALVEEAARARLTALALTDHDTVAGYARAAARGRELGVEIVPGCELTVYDGAFEVHLLALFSDVAGGSAFAALLAKLQLYRRNRLDAILARLQTVGCRLTAEEVLVEAGETDSVGRPHVAAALLKKGYARDMQQALYRFLGEGRPGDVPKFKLRPEEAFAAIRASGGLSILAHPGRMHHDEIIPGLFERGLDGIEALYLAHAEMTRRFYVGLAQRYHKVISGGTDFHGPKLTPKVHVGDGGVDAQTLLMLRLMAQSKRGRT